jgi:NADPH:quinone reductase-like Zn-dependent oxidoreductase
VRAALYDRFGPPSVLRIGDAPDPTPGPDELGVAVRAAALNPKDVLVRKGRFRWLSSTRFPRGTGYDFAGEVIAVGPEVVDQRIGDLVYGMLNGDSPATRKEELLASRTRAGVDLLARGLQPQHGPRRGARDDRAPRRRHDRGVQAGRPMGRD